MNNKNYQPVALPLSYNLFADQIEMRLTNEIINQNNNEELLNFWSLWTHGFFNTDFKYFFFRIPTTNEEEIYFDNIIKYFYYCLLHRIQYVRYKEDGFNRDIPIQEAELFYYPKATLTFRFTIL